MSQVLKGPLPYSGQWAMRSVLLVTLASAQSPVPSDRSSTQLPLVSTNNLRFRAWFAVADVGDDDALAFG
jgi:hypothetical protein